MSIPDGTLILEGLDAADDPFLGLMDLSGWKLVLDTLDAQRMRVAWYLVGDWRLDTHPDYYPGATLGEVSFLAAFGGGSPDHALQTEIPWPFARDGRLPLDAPARPDGTWSTPVRVAALTSIFDISGPALKDLPVSQIDAAALVKASDAVRLESGTDADGAPFFRVRAAITKPFPCVAFAGLQLAPGAGELVLTGTLGLASISFGVDLTLSGGSTLDVISPFLVISGDSPQPPREVVTLLAPRSTGPVTPPDVRIALAAPPGTTFPLARADIPARWDSIARVHPTDPQPFSLLGLAPGGVDGSRLIGYRFGALSGDAPHVQLEIRGATPDPTGIVLEVALTVQTSTDPADRFELSGTWRFQLDTRRLALVPARSIHFSGADITVMGLTITGLRSLGVSWEGGSLSLSATGLRAFFDRISDLSDPSDPSRGFELDVPVLRVDSGGLDLELAVTGGVTKMQGIGEAFKGTRGKVSIVDSKLMTGSLTAEGPLPHLDNATGSITVLFKDGLQIAQASAEFQLGLHRRVDWWLELDLKSVRLDLVAPEGGGRVALILMITGKITFRPAGLSSAIAAYLEDAQLEFKDLVLSKAFDTLPPGISLSVHLARPWTLNLLGVFTFEIRGIGLGRGVDAGQGALSIDGQIFFSSRDLLNVRVDFHKLTLQKPEDGSLIPRVSLESLEVRFEYKPTLKLYGFVGFVDTPERKGFFGGGQLVVSDAFGLSVLLEFVRAKRPSDGAMLRVWMVYAELLSLEILLEPEFALFLRDVGIGFGWRKTLATLDDPELFLQAPGQRSRTYAPHLPSSWIDDLEGSEASPRWTVVMSAWLTIGAGPRGLICPLVLDLLFVLRSDLTIFSGVHGWAFNSLDRVRDGSPRPVVSGLAYFSLRDRQFLLSMMTDPAAAAARGIPPAVVAALLGRAFNFTLEAGPGRFRLELGWPRQLSFPLEIPTLGSFTGWAGLLVRVVNGALTVGLGLEIGLAFSTDTEVDLGVFGFSISASGRLSIYGEILARIGSSPALFGSVGVNAFVILQINAWVRVKIGFFRLSLSFSFGFALIITARVSFGISTGFGLEGYAGVSLRIWKFQAGGTVALAINRGALDEARRRVVEGATAGSSDGALPAASRARLLPVATGELPVVGAENPRWTVFHIQRDDRVYVLLLPADDSWFATPPSATQVVPQTDPEPQYQYAKSASADYEIDLQLQGIARVDHLGNPGVAVPASGNVHLSCRCDWNLVIPAMPGTSAPGQARAEPVKLGDWFFERPVVYDELRVIEAIVNDPRYRPELLTDWRVRAEPGAQDSGNAAGVRPDVRLPQFGDDDELYDLALEDAFGSSADDAISWDRIALGMTRWLSEDRSQPFRDHVDGMFSQAPASGATTPRAASPVERTYAAAAQLRRNRSALVARLLIEFRDWALGTAPDGKPGPLLAACGLAFDGQIAPAHTADWSLDVVSLTVQRGYDGEADDAGGTRQAVHRLVADPAGSQLRDAHITPQQGGLGFRRARHQYRIRDILEFQDRDGMHFSWLLECIDDQGVSRVMSAEELSGLVHRDSQFEHFDHYEVERVNVSQQARDGQQAGSVVEFSLRPGFVPSFLDLGAGDQKFFLVAPRFEFSDHFAAPAAVGDLLVYRITALDVFGNRSQTTEYLTARKRLDPPPPPESVLIAYTADVTAAAVSERIEITVAPGSDAGGSGGAVRHEVWTRPRPIADGGYYATGDDTAEIASDDHPTIDPRGMTRVGDLAPGATSLVLADLAGFRHGTVYEFHARAVSPDGNASRLVRSRQTAHITAGPRALPDRPRAYLERIPPPAITAAWLSGAELRAEVQTTAEPRPDRDAATGFARAAVDDLTQRELTLRMLHQPHLDAGQRHPTGGYLVTVRDRDATASDDPVSYRRLAEIEVIREARYGATPPSSEPWSKWHGRYLQAGEFPAFRIRNASGDGDDLGWLDWGPDQPYASADSLGLFPDGTRIHVILSEVLAALQARAGGLGHRLAIRQGRPGAEALARATYRSLQVDHAEAKDPHGSGLLKLLGRSVDLAVGNDGGAMPVRDLLATLTAIVTGLPPSAPGAASPGPGHDQVWLEVLINGDRRTAMSYYRLSVQPRLRALPPEPGEARRGAFQSFSHALARAFARDDGSALPGLLDATQDSYEALTRRFLRQRPLLDGEPPPVALGVAFYEDGGSFARPRGSDDTIAIQLYYTEPYARRFAYRVQRLSRYLPLYRELGLPVDPDPPAAPPDALATVLARLPRVKPPAAPAARFLGNFLRDGVACSEWIVEAHDEEALVQSSETLRNRLGYRGAAWSLFSEVMPDWDVWSGWRRPAGPTASWVAWSGDRTWADRGAAVERSEARGGAPDGFAGGAGGSAPRGIDDGRLPGPSAAELEALRSDAAWPEPAPALPRTAGLAGHPFTGLLLPRGMVVRVPRLPYYYRYRMGVFARADDVDSTVRLVDASPVLPSRVPTVDPASAGWTFNAAGRLEIWWRVPSVWDSLDDTERALWVNERPFATRLWDFDLRYALQIRRFQGDPLFETITPVLAVELAHPDPTSTAPRDLPGFVARTAGTSLSWDHPGSIEERALTIDSPFLPRLRLTAAGSIASGFQSLALAATAVFQALAAEFDFVIELHCSRAYGSAAPTVTTLSRAPGGPVP